MLNACFCRAEIEAVFYFILTADTFKIRACHPAATTCVTISVRQEGAHVSVDKSDNTPVCPLSENTETLVLHNHQGAMQQPSGTDRLWSDGEIE